MLPALLAALRGRPGQCQLGLHLPFSGFATAPLSIPACRPNPCARAHPQPLRSRRVWPDAALPGACGHSCGHGGAGRPAKDDHRQGAGPAACGGHTRASFPLRVDPSSHGTSRARPTTSTAKGAGEGWRGGRRSQRCCMQGPPWPPKPGFTLPPAALGPAGFQTHTTPVLLSVGERAELGTEKYIPGKRSTFPHWAGGGGWGSPLCLQRSRRQGPVPGRPALAWPCQAPRLAVGVLALPHALSSRCCLPRGYIPRRPGCMRNHLPAFTTACLPGCLPAASGTLEGVVILRENPDYVEMHE